MTDARPALARRLLRVVAAVAAPMAALLAGCGFLGASEITVDARNDSDRPMRVQVVEGIGAQGADYGPEHTLDPLDERPLELAVPGGDWTVTVNGSRLFESGDVVNWRGRVPITIIVPAPDAPIRVPYWEVEPGADDADS